MSLRCSVKARSVEDRGVQAWRDVGGHAGGAPLHSPLILDGHTHVSLSFSLCYSSVSRDRR